MNLIDFEIKAFTSCIRNVDYFKSIFDKIYITTINKNCESGDLVLLKIKDCESGYGILENFLSENIKLNNNDYIVGVLGNRFSGTNVYGELIESHLEVGMRLFQLSISGIFGSCAFVENSHNKGKATVAEIVGFLNYNKQNLNIKDLNILYNKIPQLDLKLKNNIFVFGTSAEVGKTTFVCNLAKTCKNGFKVSCAKVCGTGRLKDKNNYINANCDFAIDYVDLGIPSTYKQSKGTINHMINKITKISNQYSDYSLFEVGGDMLEGGADIILDFAKSIDAYIFVVVNDAMGALYARELLKDYQRYFFVAWRPNIKALEERLHEKVYNIFTFDDVKKLWGLIYDKK